MLGIAAAWSSPVAGEAVQRLSGDVDPPQVLGARVPARAFGERGAGLEGDLHDRLYTGR